MFAIIAISSSVNPKNAGNGRRPPGVDGAACGPAVAEGVAGARAGAGVGTHADVDDEAPDREAEEGAAEADVTDIKGDAVAEGDAWTFGGTKPVARRGTGSAGEEVAPSSPRSAHTARSTSKRSRAGKEPGARCTRGRFLLFAMLNLR